MISYDINNGNLHIISISTLHDLNILLFFQMTEYSFWGYVIPLTCYHIASWLLVELEIINTDFSIFFFEFGNE